MSEITQLAQALAPVLRTVFVTENNTRLAAVFDGIRGRDKVRENQLFNLAENTLKKNLKAREDLREMLSLSEQGETSSAQARWSEILDLFRVEFNSDVEGEKYSLLNLNNTRDDIGLYRAALKALKTVR